ncbi:MAG: hypothetical protein R6V54_07270 [Desulfobacteraceae bacterium]
MKQRFKFETDAEKGLVTLSESAEGEPGYFMPVAREEYDLEEMKTAVEQGKEVFIEKMRRINFFPPYDLSCKIFDAAEGFFAGGMEEKLVVEYDDVEGFPDLEEAVEDEEEYVELDDLLKDEKPSEDLSEDDIKEIDSDDDTPKFQPDDDSEHEN